MIRQTRNIFSFLIIVIFCSAILYQFINLSEDMIMGDFAAKKLLVSPRCGFMRIFENVVTIRNQSVNRLAADFAQVFFPAQNITSLDEAYNPAQTSDPWHRPSCYPPFVHYICFFMFGRFPYGYASFFHMLIQTILFFCGFRVAFSTLGLRYWFFPMVLFASFALFLTPVGLSWFERGQFSLYVALSHLWLLLGLILNKKIYIGFSAICAFIKWTSFPFVFVIFAVYFMLCRDKRELKYFFEMGTIFLLTIAALFLFNLQAGIHFVERISFQEWNFAPDGISLTRLLPRPLIKFLPLLFILCGFLRSKINLSFEGEPVMKDLRYRLVYFIPFFSAIGILFITYPTFAYDYSVPNLLGLIPFLIYWAKLTKLNGLYQRLVLFLFFFFIVTASFFFEIYPSDLAVLIFYLCISGAIFSLDFLGSLHLSRKKEA